jgi:hypothetical protein
MGGDIADNNRPGSNDCPSSNGKTLSDGRSGPNVGSGPNLNGTRQFRSGGNMDMIANNTVMLDNRSRIDNHICAQTGASVKHSPGHHSHSLTRISRGGHNGLRVDCVDRLHIILPGQFK